MKQTKTIFEELSFQLKVIKNRTNLLHKFTAFQDAHLFQNNDAKFVFNRL